MRWSVIVPSCDDAKLMGFIDSLCTIQPDLEQEPSRIVVVSDGLSRETRRHLEGVRWVKGRKPFIFPRAINMGAEAAGEDDILICGDDVRFTTMYQIDAMQNRLRGCAVAVAPKVRGVCGQPAQRYGSDAENADWVAFICVLIRRDMWERVGPLDERFTGYGYDDVDWCRRSAQCGPIIIDSSMVIHLDESSYRSKPDWQEAYRVNHEIYQDKWSGATEVA